MRRLLTACLSLVLTTGAASAATVLADFDSGSSTFNIGLATGGLSTSTIGSGVCSGASAAGNASGGALCGNLLDDELRFADRDFNRIRSISFSLATFTISGDLDPPDVLSVFAGSENLVTFNGINDTDTMQSVSGLLGAGIIIGPAFTDFTVGNIAGFGLGEDDLVFSFLSSNSSEYMAVDSVSIEIIPLPAGIWLMLAGIGSLGVAGRRRKRAA